MSKFWYRAGSVLPVSPLVSTSLSAPILMNVPEKINPSFASNERVSRVLHFDLPSRRWVLATKANLFWRVLIFTDDGILLHQLPPVQARYDTTSTLLIAPVLGTWRIQECIKRSDIYNWKANVYCNMILFRERNHTHTTKERTSFRKHTRTHLSKFNREIANVSC